MPKKGVITSPATKLLKAVEAYSTRRDAEIDDIVRKYWLSRLMIALSAHVFLKTLRDLQGVEPTWYGRHG
jgi:hypothetical protein